MPILSNFPAGASGGGNASDYATITFHDWDLTPLGSIVVPKGEDASAAVTAFENTLKATTFDEGSQYYSSDKSKPLTNKKGYSFEGVWLDYDDETVTQYGICVEAGNANNTLTLSTPDGVSFANVSQNMFVKAAYGSNNELVTGYASNRYYTIEVVGYIKCSATTYKVLLRIKREDAEGKGVPRMRKGVLRLLYRTNNVTNEAGEIIEYGKNRYNLIFLKNIDDEIVTFYVDQYSDSVDINVVDAYDRYEDGLSSGARSMTTNIEKGTAAEKTGYAYLGALRAVNDYLSSNGAIGLSPSTTILRGDLGITASGAPTMIKNKLFSAWRLKNPQWESENHPPFEDLTTEEMQYALDNEGALMPAE